MADIPNPGSRCVQHSEFDLLICRSGERFYAVENVCPHAGSKLAGGKIRGHFIFCPEHGARFDLRDGTSANTLTSKPLKTFRLQVEAEQLQIELP
jgi:3-phenylpropionate/trans-cinnamate dioxygenase ferredoxin subunit